MIKEPPVLISICMITYNHEGFISQAIEGVLMQKNVFPLELIIADDCSTDNTRAICLEYRKKHPDIIKLILHNENVGFMRNFNDTISVCNGKYVAVCEGDDYWIDQDKLYKQISFLEKNENFGLIYTNALIYNNSDQVFKRSILGGKIPKKGLIFSNPIPTLTTLFRKDLFDKYIFEINPVSKNWKMADYPCWLWFYYNSKISYLNETTGVYRLLTESASHSKDKQKKYFFNLNSFEITDFFVSQYGSQDSYKELKEYRNMYMYLFCIKNRLEMKMEYENGLKSLKEPEFATKLFIFIFLFLRGGDIINWLLKIKHD